MIEQQSPYNIMIEGHDPPVSQPQAAAASGEDIRELVDDLLEVLLTNVERRMRLQGTTTDKEILAHWQPYEVSIRARLERLLTQRDDAIRAFVADLLDLLQERADMSDAWCAAEMAALDRLLGEG